MKQPTSKKLPPNDTQIILRYKGFPTWGFVADDWTAMDILRTFIFPTWSLSIQN